MEGQVQGTGSLVSYIPLTTEAFLVDFLLRHSLWGEKSPLHLIFLNLYELNECLSPHIKVVSS